MSLPIKTLLAAGALVVSSGAAFAATATATASLNVRSGPSTGYGVVDTLRPGETVGLLGCSGSWCEVSLGGATGFASRSYLDLEGRRTTGRVIIEEYDPGLVAGLRIGGYWEGRPYYARDGLYFYGGRWYADRPGRSGWANSWRREIRQDWRRDARREWREERRDDRRETRRDWREERRDRVEDRRDRAADRREMRRDRMDAVREQRSETRQDRREARQEMRQETRQERRGRGGRDG